jgi:uncharacterized protein (TIGR03790 family)
MAHPFIRLFWSAARLAVCLLVCLAGPLGLAGARAAAAQTGRNVLLIDNRQSEASVKIADHYAKVREVPPDQRVTIDVPVSDEINARDFAGRIERPIAGWFQRTSGQDRILYIVLTKGVPLRVTGTTGLQGTVASVDSELTLMYRKLAGRAAPPAGRIDNPYFLGGNPIANAKTFSHQQHDIFLVTRLDGYTVEDVMALIDRAKAPTAQGRFILDMKSAFTDKGNVWLQAAADRLTQMGHGSQVLLDTGGAVVTGQKDVIGYYSWGSNDPAVHQRNFNLTFLPGAIGAMFVSTDGRTFTAPPENWNISTWDKKDTFHAGSPQSLAGDLIHAGITGVAGHVAEPYLDATIRPEILFPAYASGFNLAESFYLAMPYLSWQTVVVGDPLCTPFPRTWAPPQLSLDPPLDTQTELPPFFLARRMQATSEQSTTNLKPDAVKAAMRGEVRLARGDKPGAREAFEQATTIDPQFNGAHLAVASLYEETAEYDKAVAHYRRMVANVPNDIIGLNNLAFALAARIGKPAEALSFAERAYELSQGSPAVADTYAWVLHLVGDNQQALRYAQDAVAGAPTSSELRVHYATILLAIGENERAEKELAKAIELYGGLKSRADVQELQKKLEAARSSRPSAPR